MPERLVTDIRPLGDGSGADGYELTRVRSGALLRRGRASARARGVIVAAGALGTNRLLQRCRLNGSLPRMSDRLGQLVRTNSESIMAVLAPEGAGYDFTESVAISSSIHVDETTHIETVTYGAGGDSQVPSVQPDGRVREARDPAAALPAGGAAATVGRDADPEVSRDRAPRVLGCW